jgi:hypothetical protein
VVALAASAARTHVKRRCFSGLRCNMTPAGALVSMGNALVTSGCRWSEGQWELWFTATADSKR